MWNQYSFIFICVAIFALTSCKSICNENAEGNFPKIEAKAILTSSPYFPIFIYSEPLVCTQKEISDKKMTFNCSFYTVSDNGESKYLIETLPLCKTIPFYNTSMSTLLYVIPYTESSYKANFVEITDDHFNIVLATKIVTHEPYSEDTKSHAVLMKLGKAISTTEFWFDIHTANRILHEHAISYADIVSCLHENVKKSETEIEIIRLALIITIANDMFTFAGHGKALTKEYKIERDRRHNIIIENAHTLILSKNMFVSSHALAFKILSLAICENYSDTNLSIEKFLHRKVDPGSLWMVNKIHSEVQKKEMMLR